MPTRDEIQLVIHTLRQSGSPVAVRRDGMHSRPLPLHYRNNADGTIRWLWPAGSRRADCLRFHHPTTRRAALGAAWIRFLFSMGAGRLFANGALLLFVQPATVAAAAAGPGKEFAISIDPPGVNRGSSIWHLRKDKGMFTKVAPEHGSASLMTAEKRTLDQVDRNSFTRLRIPRVIQSGASTLSIEDISVVGAGPTSTFGPLHDLALCELYQATASRLPVEKTGHWAQTQDCLNLLQQVADKRIPPGLVRKLVRLAEGLDGSIRIPCCRSVGEFTPGNMICAGQELRVFDWSGSIPDAPAVWDAFHYIVQSGISIHRRQPREILRDIRVLEESELVKQLREQDGFDLSLCLRLYLLTHLSGQLALFCLQPHWNPGTSRLIRAWNAILNGVLGEQGILTRRQLLCMDLFDFLRDKSYAAMRWTEEAPETLASFSDLDLCVDRSALPIVRQFLSAHEMTTTCRRYRKSFMTRFMVGFADGSAMKINAIRQFRMKGLEFMDAAQVLANARMNVFEVRRPSLEADFDFTWMINMLTGLSVPEKYRPWFLLLPEDRQAALHKYFQSRWHALRTDFSMVFNYDAGLASKLRVELMRQLANRGIAALYHRFMYWIDTTGLAEYLHRATPVPSNSNELDQLWS